MLFYTKNKILYLYLYDNPQASQGEYDTDGQVSAKGSQEKGHISDSNPIV